MARREIIQYVDDLDGKPLEEDDVQVIHFSLDGNDYVIDVSEEHALKIRAAFQPYIDAGRRATASTRRVRRRLSGQTNADFNRKVRKWANSRGIKVATRGKIPDTVIAQYHSWVASGGDDQNHDDHQNHNDSNNYHQQQHNPFQTQHNPYHS